MGQAFCGVDFWGSFLELGVHMVNEEINLGRDCEVTIIPGGDVVKLEKGSRVFVTQALGGTVTIQNKMGLYRVGSNDLDALGDEAAGYFEEEVLEAGNEEPFSEERVWDALKTCYDPEIPINIVDLGLVYDLGVTAAGDDTFDIAVKMTLTAQGCGMGPSIAADAKGKIKKLGRVSEVCVDIVWDPVWNPQMITEKGRRVLDGL